MHDGLCADAILLTGHCDATCAGLLLQKHLTLQFSQLDLARVVASLDCMVFFGKGPNSNITNLVTEGPCFSHVLPKAYTPQVLAVTTSYPSLSQT